MHLRDTLQWLGAGGYVSRVVLPVLMVRLDTASCSWRPLSAAPHPFDLLQAAWFISVFLDQEVHAALLTWMNLQLQGPCWLTQSWKLLCHWRLQLVSGGHPFGTEHLLGNLQPKIRMPSMPVKRQQLFRQQRMYHHDHSVQLTGSNLHLSECIWRGMSTRHIVRMCRI